VKNLILAALTIATLSLAPLLASASQGYEVTVKGMTCADCAATVKEALSKIPGIEKNSVKVVLKEKKATFSVANNDKEISAQVKKAIEDAGYTVAAVTPVADSKTKKN
jgi:copper chaperone CopZ